MPRLPLAAATSLAALAFAVTGAPRVAYACDPAEYLTPVDLVDRADVVALVEVTAIASPRDDGTRVTATRIEALKGAPAATLTLSAPGGTCAPGFVIGTRGIVFADAAGDVIGLYDGFLTAQLPRWTAALRSYVAGATAAERGAPLAELAAGRDWSSSFQAAYALSDRVELLLALDAATRARLVARAGKLSAEHPLHGLVTRLHPAAGGGAPRKRGRTRAALGAVAAATFDAIADPAALADAIAAPRPGAGLRRRCDVGAGVCFDAAAQTRIAAFERCERVHGRSLDRFTVYTYDQDAASWRTRADACRRGTSVRAP